jgi:hypothetical protein
MYKTINF